MVFYLQNTNLHRVGINCEIFHEKHAHRITFIALKTNVSQVLRINSMVTTFPCGLIRRQKSKLPTSLKYLS